MRQINAPRLCEGAMLNAYLPRRCRMTNSPSGSRCSSVSSLCTGFVIFLFCAVPYFRAQQVSSSPANTSSQEPQSELQVEDESATAKVAEAAKIRVNVHLVLVRVVVRDTSSHAIGNLRKEDFELFDNGKPQTISEFDAEHITQLSATSGAHQTAAGKSKPLAPSELPTRYVAYLFDDARMTFDNLAKVREAAQHRVDELPPTDRAAVFSTSGQTNLDFTDDRAALHQAFNHIQAEPLQGRKVTDCPDISLYMADAIVNKNDQYALNAAVDEFIQCNQSHLITQAAIEAVVRTLARQVLILGEEQSRLELRLLNNVVQRMSALPGQRILVLISPGFLSPEYEYEYNGLIDRALRDQVIINTLDARGLYMLLALGDASSPQHPGGNSPSAPWQPGSKTFLDAQAASLEGDVLLLLANSTGGTVFHNNNDMNEGLRRVADAPEYYYVLGFAPQDLKNDGKFHTIKVNLTNRQHYDLQARRGYYAPRPEADAAQQTRREIEDEVFAREELHQFPVELHTEFFKPSDDLAKLTVLTRVDVKRLQYKQVNDRNLNEVTVVTAVFDHNGNFVQADQKLVKMRWTSETLQTKLGSGITLKTSFDIKPGRYFVRVVARDHEQQVMSAENGSVEIP